MGRNDGDGDRHAGLQQVDHLLVCEGADRVFADLHQPAALSQPSLPGVAEVLHLCDQAVVLDVEAQLAQLVPPQTELLAGGPGADGLQPGGDLVKVLRLPVLDVDNDALALVISFSLNETKNSLCSRGRKVDRPYRAYLICNFRFLPDDKIF